MKKNMSIVDRFIRPLLAAALLILYFTGTVTGTFGIVLLILAIILLLTSIFGYCPIYHALGWSTLPKNQERAAHV
jgi:hypothetical protein